MDDVVIGEGNLAGKGVYANRVFEAGEIVIQYSLTPLTEQQFADLDRKEKIFTHSHWGQIFLYGEPERYVNHSPTPNTYQNLKIKADIALRDIAKGEPITTDATKDDVAES